MNKADEAIVNAGMSSLAPWWRWLGEAISAPVSNEKLIQAMIKRDMREAAITAKRVAAQRTVAPHGRK